MNKNRIKTSLNNKKKVIVRSRWKNPVSAKKLRVVILKKQNRYAAIVSKIIKKTRQEVLTDCFKKMKHLIKKVYKTKRKVRRITKVPVPEIEKVVLKKLNLTPRKSKIAEVKHNEMAYLKKSLDTHKNRNSRIFAAKFKEKREAARKYKKQQRQIRKKRRVFVLKQRYAKYVKVLDNNLRKLYRKIKKTKAKRTLGYLQLLDLNQVLKILHYLRGLRKLRRGSVTKKLLKKYTAFKRKVPKYTALFGRKTQQFRNFANRKQKIFTTKCTRKQIKNKLKRTKRKIATTHSKRSKKSTTLVCKIGNTESARKIRRIKNRVRVQPARLQKQLKIKNISLLSLQKWFANPALQPGFIKHTVNRSQKNKSAPFTKQKDIRRRTFTSKHHRFLKKVRQNKQKHFCDTTLLHFRSKNNATYWTNELSARVTGSEYTWDYLVAAPGLYRQHLRRAIRRSAEEYPIYMKRQAMSAALVRPYTLNRTKNLKQSAGHQHIFSKEQKRSMRNHLFVKRAFLKALPNYTPVYSTRYRRWNAGRDARGVLKKQIAIFPRPGPETVQVRRRVVGFNSNDFELVDKELTAYPFARARRWVEKRINRARRFFNRRNARSIEKGLIRPKHIFDTPDTHYEAGEVHLGSFAGLGFSRLYRAYKTPGNLNRWWRAKTARILVSHVVSTLSSEIAPSGNNNAGQTKYIKDSQIYRVDSTMEHPDLQLESHLFLSRKRLFATSEGSSVFRSNPFLPETTGRVMEFALSKKAVNADSFANKENLLKTLALSLPKEKFSVIAQTARGASVNPINFYDKDFSVSYQRWLGTFRAAKKISNAAISSLEHEDGEQQTIHETGFEQARFPAIEGTDEASYDTFLISFFNNTFPSYVRRRRAFQNTRPKESYFYVKAPTYASAPQLRWSSKFARKLNNVTYFNRKTRGSYVKVYARKLALEKKIRNLTVCAAKRRLPTAITKFKSHAESGLLERAQRDWFRGQKPLTEELLKSAIRNRFTSEKFKKFVVHFERRKLPAARHLSLGQIEWRERQAEWLARRKEKDTKSKWLTYRRNLPYIPAKVSWSIAMRKFFVTKKIRLERIRSTYTGERTVRPTRNIAKENTLASYTFRCDGNWPEWTPKGKDGMLPLGWSAIHREPNDSWTNSTMPYTIRPVADGRTQGETTYWNSENAESAAYQIWEARKKSTKHRISNLRRRVRRSIFRQLQQNLKKAPYKFAQRLTAGESSTLVSPLVFLNKSNYITLTDAEKAEIIRKKRLEMQEFYKSVATTADAVTQYFPGLMRLTLERYLATQNPMTQEQVRKAVRAVYWNLRFYLQSRRQLKLRFENRDKYKNQRITLREEFTQLKQEKYFDKYGVNKLRYRLQPHRFVRRPSFQKTAGQWLRQIFPRFRAFHLENPERYENMALSLTRIFRAHPSRKNPGKWRTNTIVGPMEKRYNRLLAVGRTTSRFENLLMTTRRAPIIAGQPQFSELRTIIATKDVIAKNSFFKRLYSTESQLIYDRAARERRLRADYDVFFADARLVSARHKVRLRLPTHKNDYVTPRTIIQLNAPNLRALRAKSPRNLQYLQRNTPLTSRARISIPLSKKLVQTSRYVFKNAPKWRTNWKKFVFTNNKISLNSIKTFRNTFLNHRMPNVTQIKKINTQLTPKTNFYAKWHAPHIKKILHYRPFLITQKTVSLKSRDLRRLRKGGNSIRRKTKSNAAVGPTTFIKKNKIVRFIKPKFRRTHLLKTKIGLQLFQPASALRAQKLRMRSELLRDKKYVQSFNMGIDARDELWQDTTARWMKKERFIKQWLDDTRFWLKQNGWLSMPRGLYNRMRSRIRKLEWREPDEHFFREKWRYAFKFYPNERRKAPWLEQLMYRRSLYHANKGTYRRYQFPREQKRLKWLQYYRKAVYGSSNRLYIKKRRWPRLRIYNQRLFRSLFSFRNKRTAQRHFKKNARRHPKKEDGFATTLKGLANRLDVNLILLKIAPTTFWAKQMISLGLLRVNNKIPTKEDYRLKDNDFITWNHERIARFRENFKSILHRYTNNAPATGMSLPKNFDHFPKIKMSIYRGLPREEELPQSSRLNPRLYKMFRADSVSGK